ncbi:hypothetical protein, partial [Escherichia coli]|uniref:hypothetical protein n=1 Tax=Escherichia coli TaxID=562 RepID=UPI001BCD186C
ILLRQKQKKLIMLPSETMIWQPEFTDKTLSRKPGAVHLAYFLHHWPSPPKILSEKLLRLTLPMYPPISEDDLVSWWHAAMCFR